MPGYKALTSTLVVASLVLWFMPPVIAQDVGVDDFLPATLGGSTEIKGDVNESKEVVEAETAQDAINAAVDDHMIGSREVRFGSGFGWVATGASTYMDTANINASRISKRNAYVKAFIAAKKELAEALGGLSTEGNTKVVEAMLTMDSDTESLAASSSLTSESIKQAVDMLLRGFVVYEVFDDEERHLIYVSIVTTPKTRGKAGRVAGNVIEAASIGKGLETVLAEVKAGVVPPVGGRIITVKETGEVAVIGFGSHVMRYHKNPAMQNKLRLQSLKIAPMRAKDALCGIIIGDKTMWEGDLNETTLEEIKDFEAAAKDDPLAEDDADGIRKLEETKNTLTNIVTMNDTYESARKGKLPPGVRQKSWVGADDVAYAMAVYIPSASARAAAAAKEMGDAVLVGDKPGPPGQKGKLRRAKKGPSGKVARDEDY